MRGLAHAALGMPAAVGWTRLQRKIWGACLVLGCVGTLTACEEEKKLEEPFDARRGLSQLGDAEPPFLDEDEACERMSEALNDRQESLGCDEVQIAACPALIRPAGSLACVQYSESSVDECVEVIGSYKTCRDFNRKGCYAIAVVDEKVEGCVLPGPADAGANLDSDAGELPEEDAGQEPPEESPQDAGMDASTPRSDSGAPMMDAGSDARDAAAPDAGAADAG